MLEWIMELMSKFTDTLARVLQVSPFLPYISAFADLPYLGYVNWFIPVEACVKIGMAWLAAITLFYLYGIIMRWVKLIGG